MLCLINAELYLDEGELKTQSRILHILLRRQTTELKNKIISKILNHFKKNKNNETQIFSKLYNLEFIHWELLHYRDFHIEDTNPSDELNLLKAYLLVSESVNNNYTEKYNNDESTDVKKDEFFAKKTWPMFIDQFEVNHPINPFPEMIKGLVLFNYLEYHSPFNNEIKNFLNFHKRDSSWNYILDLMNLLNSSWEKSKSDKKDKFYMFSLNQIKGYETLFESLSIDIKGYQRKYKEKKDNFSGLKDRPLFKLREVFARCTIYL